MLTQQLFINIFFISFDTFGFVNTSIEYVVHVKHTNGVFIWLYEVEKI